MFASCVESHADVFASDGLFVRLFGRVGCLLVMAKFPKTHYTGFAVSHQIYDTKQFS